MKLLGKILVAMDFKHASEEALGMSLFLAKEFDSEIILIHVIPEIKDFQMARGKIRKKVTDKLKHMEMDLKRKGIASVETITRFGIPFERIMEHAEELDVNLIVVGSGKGDKKFPLGITAERVMIYADKPVLVVKQGSRPFIRRILCPVDFSETSRRALKNAIHLSKTFQAHLTVLTVFEPLLSNYFGVGQTPGERKEKILVKRQQQQFDRFLQGFNLENLDWKKTIRGGSPIRKFFVPLTKRNPIYSLWGLWGKRDFRECLWGVPQRGWFEKCLVL